MTREQFLEAQLLGSQSALKTMRVWLAEEKLERYKTDRELANARVEIAKRNLAQRKKEAEK